MLRKISSLSRVNVAERLCLGRWPCSRLELAVEWPLADLAKKLLVPTETCLGHLACYVNAINGMAVVRILVDSFKYAKSMALSNTLLGRGVLRRHGS